MLGTFRKHSTWLWGIIIAAMAVSLVWWTGNRSDRGGAGGPIDLGSIAGKKVNTTDYFNAMREVKLQYYISRGEWPAAGADRELTIEAYKRLFLIQKQEEMGIHVGDAVVARVAAQDLKAFAKNGGSTGMELFAEKVLKPGGLSIGDYERFLRHSLGIQELVNAVGISGKLVTPQEARKVYVRENQDVSAQTVFFSASNYLAGVVVTPTALSEFYSNQMAHYRLPERVQVSYVEFKLTNFWAEGGTEMAKMTNIDQIIEAQYHQRGTNFYADMTPEKAKESIRGELHEQFALMAARKRASEFADPLLSNEGTKPEALTELAKKEGLEAKVTAPFDRSNGPEDMKVSDAFVRAAFALRDDEPIAGPIVARDAVYVIAWNKDLPSEIPAFETIKDKVARDYQMFQATHAARAAAAAFAQTATNGLAQGKAFTSLCADAKVKPILLPPFSLSTRSLPEVEDLISLQDFKQVAFITPVGEVSRSVSIMSGALVVYVQAKLPLDEKKLAEELPDFIKLFRQARQSEAFQAWFGHEASQALAGIPALRPSPSEMGSASPEQ